MVLGSIPNGGKVKITRLTPFFDDVSASIAQLVERSPFKKLYFFACRRLRVWFFFVRL